MGYIRCILYRILLVVTFLEIIPVGHSQSVDKDLSKSILNFTVQFVRRHSRPDVASRNSLVWSPLSLYQAILMVGEGAKDRTFRELQLITHLKTRKNYQQWSSYFLNDTQNNTEENRRQNISLNIANRLYADKKFPINLRFNRNLIKYYRSPMELMNFNEKEKSANRINRWISNRTNNIIKDVLKPDNIDSSTRLMIVNALYFKAPWLKPFRQRSSMKKNFTLSIKRVIQLQTMHLIAHFSYYDDRNLKSRWINLPYKGNRYVLTLALPDENIQLRGLEYFLRNSTILSNVFHALDDPNNGNKRMNLSLPKFRIESSLDFVQHFKNYYNVTSPFDANKADFSPMSASGERGLFISKVIHKAVIDVDEAGTEAAAVTVVELRGRSGMSSYEKPIELAFSRPFLFYLRDIHLQIPLFVGRFTGMPISGE